MEPHVWIRKPVLACAFALCLAQLGCGEVSGTCGEDEVCVDAGSSCSDGAQETRTRFQDEIVGAGAECVSEVQSRACVDGQWGSWSGSFAHDACEVADFSACSDPDAAHGELETRTRYERDMVPPTGECVSEPQQRQCSDGTWGDWSGTYAHESCSVEGFANCTSPPAAHGETGPSRTRYQDEKAPAAQQCVAEEQASTCTDGVWEWSGTFAAETCANGCSDPPGQDGDAGGTRHRYAAARVPSCPGAMQLQERSCDDGTWRWSGSFAEVECRDDYNAAIPKGACTDAPDVIPVYPEPREGYVYIFARCVEGEWRAGYWERFRAGHSAWIPGDWVHRDGSYSWVPGHYVD